MIDAKSAIELRTVKAIRTGKSVLLLGEDEYRTMLRERYHVASTKELTEQQGRDLVEHFRSLGFGKSHRKWTCTLCAPRPKKEAIPAGTIYPVSTGQLTVIYLLKKTVKWNCPQGYERWLKKYFDLTEIKTSLEASMVIVALKGLIRSQKRCTGCNWAYDIDNLPAKED